ncbi:HAD hydrolase-like protein [Candidatus Saccharibacteria bacterium]|nr:HAD hydrolase-like protein [Candidatus Saccharibacteria bacterium]
MKKTIAIDIDDVLAASADGFLKFSNKRWGTNLRSDDYTEHWAEMWGIDFDEVKKRRQIMHGEKLFTKYRLFDEAKPILKQLAKSYRLVVVSSRSSHVQADTLEWINQEFPAVFTEIHFAKMWDMENISVLERLKMTKTELCQEVGADYLIDDQLKHCSAAARAGIKTILFGDYKWNQMEGPLPKNITRTKDWPEVLAYFDGQS